MKTCTTEGCVRPSRSRGLCSLHYSRYLKPPKPRYPPVVIEKGRRYCHRCEQWWPIEPGKDIDGNMVYFWIVGTGVCRACGLERRHEREAARSAA